MTTIRWAPAGFDWEPLASRFVRAGPFRDFLRRYLAQVPNIEDALEDIAERHVTRFGGSFEYRFRWLKRVLAAEGDALLNLFLVDEVMTLLGHHPLEVYGEEWWTPQKSNGGGTK